MRRASDYVVGWIDTDIHDFLSGIEDPSSMPYALITCVDSSHDVADLACKSLILKEVVKHGKVIGEGIFLPTRQLLAMERQKQIFFGFDEVWFFSRDTITPKPTNLTIVGPSEIVPKKAEIIAEWMYNNGGSLGVGDGTGMNFWARLRGVPKYLVQSFAHSGPSGPK